MGLIQRIILGIFWGQTGKVFEVILGLAFTMVVGRYMGPAGYGIYSLIMSIVGLLVVISSFGFAEAMGRFIPKVSVERSQEALSYLFKSLLKKRIIIVLVLSLMIILLRESIAEIFAISAFSKYILFAALLIFSQGATDLLASFFNALLKIKTLTMVKLSTQATSLVLTLILFRLKGATVSAVLSASLIASLLGLGFYLLEARPHLFKIPVESIPLGPIYRFGLILWLMNLGIFALANHIDKILIGYLLRDTAQIGYYSIAATLLTNFHGLLSAGWGITILPALSEAQAKQGLLGMTQVLNIYFKLLILVMLPALMFLGYYANTFILGLFGSAYSPSITLLRIYISLDILTIFFIGGVAGFSLYVVGKERLVLKLCILSGVLNIVLDLILIPLYNALGAIIATGISVAIFSLLVLIFTFKYVPIKYPYRFIGKVFLAGIICLFCICWVKIQNLWSLSVIGILYVILLAVSLYFLKILEPQDKELLNKLRKSLTQNS
jgi:O-antigen/teichoic acid export membrane protein